MKKKVIAMFVKSGWSKTLAEAIVHGLWEEAERHGCQTENAFFKVISKLAAETIGGTK